DATDGADAHRCSLSYPCQSVASVQSVFYSEQLFEKAIGAKMKPITLCCSTGSERADTILRGLIGIWEIVFPDRIRGYYLAGSYSNGSATPTSDLDLIVPYF